MPTLAVCMLSLTAIDSSCAMYVVPLPVVSAPFGNLKAMLAKHFMKFKDLASGFYVFFKKHIILSQKLGFMEARKSQITD